MQKMGGARKAYLSLDTRVLMTDGEFLIPTYAEMGPGYVVVLSRMVLQELDRQKNGRNAETAPFAREAARRIEELMTKSGRVGESSWRLRRHSVPLLDLESCGADANRDTDAAIIDLVVKYAGNRETNGQLVVASRDRIQRIRGIAAGLATLDPDEIARGKSVRTAPFVPVVIRGSNCGGRSEARGELQTGL